MSEKKDKPAIAPVEVDETPEGKEIATVDQATVPATTGGTMAMGEASGEVGASDIKYPTFRIIQKMSENPDKLDEGTLTLDNTMVIGGDKNTARISILSIHKYFREVLPYGSGTMPQNFNSAEEAIAAGFRIARSKADRDSGVPIVEDAARAVVGIEQPEGALDRGFPYEIDGTRMTLAMWWIQSSAYPRVAKYVFSKLRFDLVQTGLLPAVWSVSSEKIKGGSGDYFVPTIKLLNEERSAKFVTDLKDQIKL